MAKKAVKENRLRGEFSPSFDNFENRHFADSFPKQFSSPATGRYKKGALGVSLVILSGHFYPGLIEGIVLTKGETSLTLDPKIFFSVGLILLIYFSIAYLINWWKDFREIQLLCFSGLANLSQPYENLIAGKKHRIFVFPILPDWLQNLFSVDVRNTTGTVEISTDGGETKRTEISTPMTSVSMFFLKEMKKDKFKGTYLLKQVPVHHLEIIKARMSYFIHWEGLLPILILLWGLLSVILNAPTKLG